MADLPTDVFARIGTVQAQVRLAPKPVKNDLGFVLLLVLGAVGAVIGAGVLSEAKSEGDRVLGGIFLGLGVLFLAGGIALFLRRRARFGTVVLGDAGFAWGRDAGTKGIAFAEIDRLVAFDKAVYSNGTPAGIDWRIEAAGRGGKVALVAWSPGGPEDALESVYGYVLARVADAWESRRKAGEALVGSGWRLDGSGLQVPAAGAVSLSELRFAGIFEGAVCLWRGSESEPFLKVPVGSPNATLLLVLVKRQLPKDAATDASTNGRVLFTRAPSRALAVICGLFVAGFAAGTAWAASENVEAPMLGGMAAVVVVCAVGVGQMVRRRFRCYERAVELRGLFGARTLRFDDLVGYDHAAVRMYHNGAYTGTNVTFAFHPETGKSLRYGTQFQGGDADFERLHDHITQLVATRLHDRILREGLEVAWGPHARITREGLVYFAHKLIGRGPEVRVPWTEVLHWTMNQGQFALTTPSHPGQELRMAASAKNFYPGFVLVQRLMGAAPARQTA